MEKHEGVARITLNRQEKRNAMSSALQAEFRAALTDSWDCHVLVISGGDGPAFCAGVDLSESRDRAARGEAAPRVYANAPDTWGATCEFIVRHPAVCIASVNGIAIGGGVSMVNSCDLAIASDRAEFVMTEMGFDTFPGLVAPLTNKMIAKKNLAWMVFTVNRVKAEQALQWGLVNKVVPHADLKAETDALVERVATLDPIAIDWAKRALNELPTMDWSTASHYGGLIGTQIRASGGGQRGALDRFLAHQPGLGQGSNPR